MVEIVARAIDACRHKENLAESRLFATAALQSIDKAGFVIMPKEASEAMEDKAADAFHEAVTAAKASFPVDWIKPVYRAMIAEALNSRARHSRQLNCSAFSQ